MSASRGPLFLLVGVAFAAGLGLGIGLERGLGRDPGREPGESHAASSRPAAAPSTADTRELERGLDALRESIASLTQALARSPARSAPSSGEAERRPLLAETVGSAELTGALLRLAAALERTGPAPRPGEAPAPLTHGAPAWVDREAAFGASGLRSVALAGDDDGRLRKEEEFQRKHLLWSTQDLLSAYGKPDTIEASGQTTKWTYSLRFPDGEDAYHFWIHDDHVIETGYSLH